jgi:hypothetical protein
MADVRNGAKPEADEDNHELPLSAVSSRSPQLPTGFQLVRKIAIPSAS